MVSFLSCDIIDGYRTIFAWIKFVINNILKTWTLKPVGSHDLYFVFPLFGKIDLLGISYVFNAPFKSYMMPDGSNT